MFKVQGSRFWDGSIKSWSALHFEPSTLNRHRLPLTLSILLLLGTQLTFAQAPPDSAKATAVEETSISSEITTPPIERKVKKLKIQGYQKGMVILSNPNDLDMALLDFNLHNRTFFRYYPVKGLKIRADLRTRAFMGETQKNYNSLIGPLVPSLPDTYGELIEQQSEGYWDLSWTLMDKNGMVLHTTLDRLYAEYTTDKIEVAAGRQRINWGVNTVWNPNDIFNVYNYTDFDYEERPGSDAFRFKYFAGLSTAAEVAVKAADDMEDAVFAGKVDLNKWNYDFQVIGGWMEGDYVAGAGWAGNIKTSGFKGEVSYFFNPDSAREALVASLTFDHALKNSLYLMFSVLYNQNGSDDGNLATLFVSTLSAKNLYPFKTAIFANATYPVSPLFNVNLATIYTPNELHPLFVSPILTYSLATDWDLDFVSQLVWQKNAAGSYQSPGQFFFLRLKFSY